MTASIADEYMNQKQKKSKYSETYIMLMRDYKIFIQIYNINLLDLRQLHI